MQTKINRVMIAGTNSNCGKTTITCGILRALQNMQVKTASFKSGPDYIDPMFHSKVINVPSRNIDTFLCDENTAKYLFAKNSKGFDICITEGVMGFYDGIGGTSYEHSSYDISQKFDMPVILIVNCKGASLSVAAIVQGFVNLYPNKIVGVILNNVSSMMFKTYKEILEKHTNIEVLGYMPNMPEASIESRHLGLVTAQEISDLNTKIDMLAQQVEKSIDLKRLIEISKQANDLNYNLVEIKPMCNCKIAIAKDKAFCFYYEDSIALLKKLGAEIVEFSPLNDEELPKDISGIYIGGGYPELYLPQLSQNKKMIASMQNAYKNNMPIFAECGGFMYLGTYIQEYKMCDIIPMKSTMQTRLQNFGYTILTADKENILFEKGQKMAAHEFHYSKSDNEDFCITAKKLSGKTWQSGYAKDNVFALYPHLHLWGNTQVAKRFLAKCEDYKNENNK